MDTPTIYDVSRLSGVSTATVSRTFTAPDRVREETRRKVLAAAEALGYQPSAIDHLTAYGHRRIALLAGRFSSYITSVRYNAFLTAMQEHGISVDDSGIVMCGRDVESATQASVELLRRPERPTAVFAFNDVLAAGVIKAATRLGLRVPDDVAVVGFDDSSSCTLLTPELSSVHVDCRRMGEICLEQLTALLNGDTEVPRLTVVPVSLRTRASSIRL